MIKHLLVLLLCVGGAGEAWATAQAGERLIYQGATNRLCTLPLEDYLKANQIKMYEVYTFDTMSTGCWRGYIGTWEIKEGWLYLVGLTDCVGKKLDPAKLFKNEKAPIKATWYSGTLHVTQGKMLQYVHAEFMSKFERDVFITVENGKVTSERVVDNAKKEEPPK